MSIEAAAPEGAWTITFKGPGGAVETTLELERDGDVLTGTQTGQGTTTPIVDGKVDGNTISWGQTIKKPMPLKLTFTGEIEGSEILGKVKAGVMGSFKFTGVKQS